MFSLNGTGLRFMGYSKPNEKGEVTATTWITFFFFPLLPIKKQKILPLKSRPFTFRILSKEKLSLLEIIKSYLSAWILMPLLILWPMPLAIKEVQDAIKIPSYLQWILMTFAIAWIIVCVLKLKSWDEKRPFKH